MDELIELILNLPPLPLKKEEWEVFLDILNALPSKSSSQLQEMLEEKFMSGEVLAIDPTKLTDLIVYMHAWQTMADLMLSINLGIVHIWDNKVKKPLGNDDLLPIIIELLPTDKKRLQEAKDKLEEAFNIEQTNEIGFNIANLYSAITNKLTVKTSYFYSTIKIEKKVIETVNEIKKQKIILQQWQLQLQQRQTELQQLIENRITDTNCTDATIFTNIIQGNKINFTDRVDQEIFSQLHRVSDAKLKPFLDEYVCVKDILLSMNRTKLDTVHKLLEVKAKITEKKPILTIDFDEANIANTWVQKLHGYMPHNPFAGIYLTSNIAFGHLSIWKTPLKNTEMDKISSTPSLKLPI